MCHALAAAQSSTGRSRPRAVTADTAMRLARYFGTSAQFWLNLQAAYDLSVAQAERGKAIEREVRPRAA